MKSGLFLVLVMLSGLACFGQEVEFCGSLTTSTEQRFQNASGIGIQYQHDIGNRFIVGLGGQFISKKASFDDIPFIDGDPNLLVADKVTSTSHRFSVRLNIQYLLRTNEHFSMSIGPEVSYNYLWGTDETDERTSQNLTRNHYSQKNALAPIGLGFISKTEIHDFLDSHLSLCFTFRPEITWNGTFPKGETPVFSGVLGYMEFQLGLAYRFKK